MKRVEIPHGDYTFPLADEEPSKPPRLDDQDCFADGAGPDDDDNDDAPPGGDDPGHDDGSDPKGDQPGPPSGEADEDDKGVEGSKPGEKITIDGMTYGDLFGDSDRTRTKDPFRVQGAGIGLQRSQSQKQNQNQASRRKALNPNCLTHSGSQTAHRFLRATTGMEFVLFVIRKAR